MPKFSTHLSLYLSAYLPVLLWAGLIFFFSSQQALPGPEDVMLNFLFKKMAHIFVYAGLYFWIFRAFALTLQPANRHKAVIFYAPLFLTVLYAISDEIHQSFVFGRSATLRDIGYDFLGASLVMLRQFRLI